MVRRSQPSVLPTLLPRVREEPPPTPTFDLPPKRSAVVAACLSCRVKKTKCDGKRPVCYACTRRRTECAYDGLAEETPLQSLRRQFLEQATQNHTYRALFEFLKTRDAQGVEAIVLQIKNGDDLDTVVNAARNGDGQTTHQHPPDATPAPSSMPPSSQGASGQAAAPGLTPPAHSQAGAGPSVSQGGTFPMLSLDVGFSIFDNPPDPDAPSYAPAAGPSNPAANDSLIAPGSQGSQLYYDPRLRGLRISYWTRVPISDESAAHLISLFLQMDQSVIGFFDANLFVRDMLAHWPRFCSCFLVNAILYVACYASPEFRGSSMEYALFEMTRSLFQADQATDQLPTLAAINIFSLGCFFHGNDILGQELVDAGTRMASRMKLKDVNPSSEQAAVLLSMVPEHLQYPSHAAEGTSGFST